MASTKKFQLKGAASSKKKWHLLNEKVSATGNDFQEKQKLSLRGMASTKRNERKAFSTKMNSF